MDDCPVLHENTNVIGFSPLCHFELGYFTIVSMNALSSPWIIELTQDHSLFLW